MNQILSMGSNFNNDNNKNVQPNKNKSKQKTNKQTYTEPSNKANINSILKVFSVLLILFGIILIADSTYGLITSKPKLKDNIKITTENIGAEATIKVSAEKPIKELTYKWGQGEETVIQGNGTVQLETVIEIPNGNNILNIKVTDYYGNKSEYQKQYINERNDKTKPTIDITVTGNSLNITANDETEMLYLTYKWNDEQETRIDIEANQQDKKQIQTSTEVKKGENTLTIVAVDKDGNKTTRTEKIKGANKPTFTVSTEGTNIVINAKDEEGINKISITVDGVTTDTGETPINKKEITAKQELTPGSHTITITVTNMSGLVEEQSFSAVL